MRNNNIIINILQHDEILRSAQDDTALGLIKGERRGDSMQTSKMVTKLDFESPLLSPSMIPKNTVILSVSEGSPTFSRDFPNFKI